MSGVLKLANILLFITSLLTSFHSFRPASLLLKEYFALFSLTPFRPRLIATPPYGATLAGCSWASRVQTRRHGVQLPARSIASAPRGIVPTSRRCRITATSSIRHPTAPGRTASPTQLLWPTGFLCGWSVGLEFPAGQLAKSDSWREQFQTISEDVSVRNVLMHSRRCAI